MKFWKRIALLCALAAVFPGLVGASAEREVPETEIMRASGFVVSEREESDVVLSGRYPNKGLYAEDIRIEVREKKTGTVQRVIRPAEDGGYRPSLLLLPFTDSGLQQIYYSADSGGSGGYGYFYVYDAAPETPRALFDFEAFGEEHPYTAEYRDNYRVLVTNGSESGYLDLSLRDKEYLDGLYRADGTLKEPVRAEVGGVNAAFPYYNRTQGVWQLMIWMPVTGLYQADALGGIQFLAAVTKTGMEPYFTVLGGYFQSRKQ